METQGEYDLDEDMCFFFSGERGKNIKSVRVYVLIIFFFNVSSFDSQVCCVGWHAFQLSKLCFFQVPSVDQDAHQLTLNGGPKGLRESPPNPLRIQV